MPGRRSRGPCGVEQHVTGSDDAGTFITDEKPTADTPAHGSSNAGVNATRANRSDPTDEPGDVRRSAP